MSTKILAAHDGSFEILKISIWNILGLHEGHFYIWYEDATNKFVWAKMGDFGGLCHYVDVQDTVHIPSEEEIKHFTHHFQYCLDGARNYHTKELVRRVDREYVANGGYLGTGCYDCFYPLREISPIEEQDLYAIQLLTGKQLTISSKHILEEKLNQ